MGDIWPYGGPLYLTWDEAHKALVASGANNYTATILTAIGVAESSLDLNVINDTPSTGDYSVGAWQINYYNGLYASRSAAFGTPKQMIDSGVARQTHAALSIASSSGFSAWSTYNSGAYKAYLHGAPPPNISGRPPIFANIPFPNPTTRDSWQQQIALSGQIVNRLAGDALKHGQIIRGTYR